MRSEDHEIAHAELTALVRKLVLAAQPCKCLWTFDPSAVDFDAEGMHADLLRVLGISRTEWLTSPTRRS